MKTVGIIGGVGPESTIEYYRLIIAAYRRRESGTGGTPVDSPAQDARATNSVPPDGHAQGARATSNPSIIINSVDLDRLLAWMKTDNLLPSLIIWRASCSGWRAPESISEFSLPTRLILSLRSCKGVRPSRCSALSKQLAMRRGRAV